MSVLVDVDPADLHLPPERSDGADPGKLARQISRHGTSTDRMPPIWVYQDPDGRYMISNGATRATRVAKLLPGTKIKAEVIGTIPWSCAAMPTVRERLP